MTTAETERVSRHAAAPRRARSRFLTTRAALAAIVSGGAALRLVGVWWGLPTRLHPDEWAIVEGAIDMATRNSFEPAHFMRPDHLEIQLSYLAYMAYAHLVHGAPPEVVFATDPGPFVLVSRAITALLGTASIVVAYLIGARFSSAAGLGAGFLVAFLPPYVEHAHYATPDVPLTLTFLCVILACVHYVQRPGWRPLVLASVAVSASIAIKYPGVVGTLVIAAAVVAAAARDRAWLRVVRHGLLAMAAVVLALFAISPVLFTNFNAVVAALGIAAETEHLGADGLGFWGNLWFYSGRAVASAGVVVLALAVVGAVWAVRARRLDALPLLGGVVVWTTLSVLALHWERWGLPMYVTVILLAALGWPVVLRWVERARAAAGSAALVRPSVLGLAALAGATLLLASVATTAQFVATDTRVASARALPARGINAEDSVFEGYTPFKPEGMADVFSRFALVDGRLEPLVAEGAALPRYLVLSSNVGDRYLAEAKYADEQAFYARVEDQFPLVATFEPVALVRQSVLVVPTLVDSVRYLHGIADGGMSGPTIRVFEIPSDGG